MSIHKLQTSIVPLPRIFYSLIVDYGFAEAINRSIESDCLRSLLNDISHGK
ncbi:hypothetical protein [Paenibacillus herberti]|uniref:hypothetical protein n=1 Tax=Paenibacillus herberti TaxID=1619309 RepID=UPI001594F57C|nr:hypothetical protein [Paenibacillus herberti]